MPRLTRAQRRIVGEIEDVTEELGLDHRLVIKRFEGSEYLTTLLELVRGDLIAAAIVRDYTLFDELLGSIIARYFFGKAGGTTLWRTKKFQRFSYFVLEKLYLQQKLAFVRDIRPLPRDVVSYIDKLNDLQNAVAHAFFPENLRGKRTWYKNKDVFTIEGFRAFRADRERPVTILMRRAGL